MKRSRTVLCGVLGACAAAAAIAAAAVPALAAAPAPASLSKIACRSTLNPGQRRVSVTSVMRHLPGTRSLAVRITLLQRSPGEATQTVSGGDLGRWVIPMDPTLGRRPADVWRLAKAVYDVGAPATYRFQVEFRWEGAGRRVLARRMLQTGSCAVRELRPDVLVRGVTVTPIPGHPRHELYVATIGNRGLSASGPFSVLFAPAAGAVSQTKPLASLAPHASRRVRFVGPTCDASDPPTVVADPGDQVDDYDRANNTMTVTCPAT